MDLIFLNALNIYVASLLSSGSLDMSEIISMDGDVEWTSND